MSPSDRLKVLVVAEEAAGVQAVRVLDAMSDIVDVAAVATALDATSAYDALVARAADDLAISRIDSSMVRSPGFATWIEQAGIDLLINVHSRFLVHPDVIAAPALGSFNLHPGPLPEFAGLNAPSWAVYRGEKRHGVTLHWMDAGIDTGAIAYEARFAIDPADTGLAVAGKCLRRGIPLIEKLVTDAARDPAAVPRIPQNPDRRNYFGRDVPNDGRIAWSQPAAEIVRFVRASDYAPFVSPWGVPQARLAATPIGILKAVATHEHAASPTGTLGRVEGGARRVAAGDEWVLVQRVRLGGRTVDAAEALVGAEKLDDG